MATKYQVTLRKRTYYDERVALEVPADSPEDAKKKALTHVRENAIIIKWTQDLLTIRPRPKVEKIEELGPITKAPVEPPVKETPTTEPTPKVA